MLPDKFVKKFFTLFSWENPTLAFPALGGLLVALSIDTYAFWWCVFFGIIPFFHFLLKTPSREKAFWGGCLFGSIVMGGGFAWGWGALPLDWVGISNPFLGFSLLFVLWVFEALIYGAIIAIASVVFFRLRTKTWQDFFLFPSLVVLSEWVSALSVSIIWSGENTPIGPHWTLGSVGYTLAESEALRSFAAIGGIYFLSFIAIFLGLSLYKIISSGRILFVRNVFFFGGIISLLFAGGILIHTHYENIPTEKEIRVATVQTQFPAQSTESVDDVLAQFETLSALLLLVNKDAETDTPVDLIVLPEDDRFATVLGVVGEKDRIKEIIGKQNSSVVLATSGRTPPFGGVGVSRLSYLDLSGNVHAVYEKSLLMPFGEYIPHWISFFVKILWGGDWLEKYEYGRGYKVGETRELGILSDGRKIGGSFCSEIVSPSIFRGLVHDGAELLFNSASHAALHGIHFIKITEKRHAQVRATETNRFFIGATNFSPSFIISNTGNVLYYGPEGKTSTVIHPDVKLLSELSVYGKYGDWIIFACFFVIIIRIGVKLRAKRKM